MSYKPFNTVLCEYEPEPTDTWNAPPKWFGIWGARLDPMLALIAKIAAAITGRQVGVWVYNCTYRRFKFIRFYGKVQPR